MLRINSLLFLFIINMSYAQYDITWINPVTDGNAINDICFVDETNGWAVGEKGKIVYSNGEDWKNIEPVTNNNLYAISLIDENCGWAVGERGTIIKLENGSWFQYYSGTQADLKDVTFIDREHGWAVGEVIMFCDGLNWTITNENLNLETVYFVDNRNGWAGGFDTILKSNGINWKGGLYSIKSE